MSLFGITEACMACIDIIHLHFKLYYKKWFVTKVTVNGFAEVGGRTFLCRVEFEYGWQLQASDCIAKILARMCSMLDSVLLCRLTNE